MTMNSTNQMMKVQGLGSLTVHTLSVDWVSWLLSSRVSIFIGSVCWIFFRTRRFTLKNFPSFNFLILNMTTVSCSFAHSFRIMRIPQPIIPVRAPPQPITVLWSGSADVIEVPYIGCLREKVTEAFEVWALSENGFCKVHPYARVKLRSEFREDTF